MKLNRIQKINVLTNGFINQERDLIVFFINYYEKLNDKQLKEDLEEICDYFSCDICDEDYCDENQNEIGKSNIIFPYTDGSNLINKDENTGKKMSFYCQLFKINKLCKDCYQEIQEEL